MFFLCLNKSIVTFIEGTLFIWYHKLIKAVKYMKKLICILVVVLFMMTFVSCGERESANSDKSTSSDINYENTRHTVTVAQPDDSLLLDANVMAEFIPRSVILTSTLENPQFNYRYFVFICNFEKNQPDFCYYSPVPVDSDGNLHIDNLRRQIVCRLFLYILW